MFDYFSILIQLKITKSIYQDRILMVNKYNVEKK